jgi:hypothetical protein
VDRRSGALVLGSGYAADLANSLLTLAQRTNGPPQGYPASRSRQLSDVDIVADEPLVGVVTEGGHDSDAPLFFCCHRMRHGPGTGR